jgi:hypothetical protein
MSLHAECFFKMSPGFVAGIANPDFQMCPGRVYQAADQGSGHIPAADKGD